MLIRIDIDTTGKENGKYRYLKYPFNEKLWYLLVPSIKYLETYEGLQHAGEIDWVATKPYFENSNGHCIIQKGGGYYAVCEYEALYFDYEFINSVSDISYPNQPLSYLLTEVAKKNNIDWKILENQ